MKIQKLLMLLLLVFVYAVTAAHADSNLVTNGNFNDGMYGWTTSTWFQDQAYGDYGGFNYASTGCQGYYCSLSQTLDTTAGDTYTISFEFTPEPFEQNASVSDLEIYFGSDEVGDLYNININNGTGTPFMLYSFTGTASSSSTVLEFVGRQDKGWDELTDVSVVTPEGGPAVVYLLLAAMASLSAIFFKSETRARSNDAA